LKTDSRLLSVTRRLAVIVGLCAVVLGGASLLLAGSQEISRSSHDDSGVAERPLVRSFPNERGGIYDRPVLLTPAPAPTAPPVAAPAPPLRNIPYHIVIKKIGVNAPVGEYGLDANQVPKVPLNGREVAWYNFSSEPGTGSNAVFAGHVTWGGRAVFYNLDDLVPGDEVLLEGEDGSKLLYTVSDSFLVDPSDPNSASVMSPTPSDAITIITCGGDPYYVGGVAGYDYTHRLIVRGTLTSVTAENHGNAPTAGG